MSDEVELHGGGYQASVQLVGAALRWLSCDGLDLVPRWSDAAAVPLYAGVVCAPWPNRIAGSTYSYAGTRHELAPTPSEPGHALHGLVATSPWRIAAAAMDRVRLVTEVDEADGWPFRLAITAEYVVSAEGLSSRVVAVNTGTVALPYGYCPHPYLTAPAPPPGSGGAAQQRIDGWSLEVLAAEVVTVDERMIPLAQVPVEGSPLDFRVARPLGTTAIDHCFGDVSRDTTGRARVRLGATPDLVTELSWGAWAPWVQIFTTDRPASPVHRTAVAVEPMSCPPDAYNSGVDLVDLAPGADHEAEWTIRLVRA